MNTPAPGTAALPARDPGQTTFPLPIRAARPQRDPVLPTRVLHGLHRLPATPRPEPQTEEQQ